MWDFNTIFSWVMENWVTVVTGAVGIIIAIVYNFYRYINLKFYIKRTKRITERYREKERKLTNDNFSISRLPRPSAELIGREDELAQLTEALTTQKHLAYIYAGGGIGKSALIFKWLKDMQPYYHGASKVFAWSFYSQGSHDTQNSSIPFFQTALPFFGYHGNMPRDDYDKG